MDLNFYFQDYINNREQHYDYYLLMEEYRTTTLFQQMIELMNENFPEWKSHKGIGFSAASFIYNNLLNFESYEDDFDMKEILSDEYESAKDLYSIYFMTYIYNLFMSYLKSDESDSEFDEEADFDEIYEKFETKILEQEVYNFKDEFVY